MHETIAQISRCQPSLGTFVEVTLRGNRPECELLELSSLVFAKIREVDACMSLHRRDSELSRLNRQAATGPVEVSPELLQVIGEALLLSNASEGLFDVTTSGLPANRSDSDGYADWRDIVVRDGTIYFRRPLQIDPGGIAKGYAVDSAMMTLPADVEATINAGGDLRMSHWAQASVAVRVPAERHERVVEFRMGNAAAATSCTIGTERAGCIIDSRTRRPLDAAYSATVFAATCMRADGLTKVAIQNPDCGRLMQALGAEVIFVDASGAITGPHPVSKGQI